MKNIFSLKKGLSAFFILFTTTAINAQSKSIAGYYITNNGDTVAGIFPNYKQPNRSFSKIAFVETTSAATIQLTPAKCSRISVQGEDDYIAYSGKRLINPIEDERVVNNTGNFGFEDMQDTVSAFIRMVTKGSGFEVFLLNDNIRKNFFYKQAGEPLQELKFKKYYDENRINEVKEYKQQLGLLFAKKADARKLALLLESLLYTETAMINFIKKVDPGAKQKVKTKNEANGFVISAGVSANFMKVVGDVSNYRTKITYNTSFSPLLSVGYIASINRNFGKFFLYPSITAYNFKNTGEISDGNVIRKATYSSSLAVLNSINGGVNLINNKRCKFFMSGGYGLMLLMNNKQISQYQNLNNTTTYKPDEEKLERLTYVFNITSGVILNNKLTAWAKYNISTNIGRYVFYAPRHSALQIAVGYKL